MSKSFQELVWSFRVERHETRVLVFKVRRNLAEGVPLEQLKRAYEAAVAP